jgi:hypothetical protein
MKRDPLEIQNLIANVASTLPESDITEIATFDELERLLLGLVNEHALWIFRGVKDHDYRLMTSLERKIPQRGVRKVLNAQLIDQFRRSIHHYRDIEYIPKDNELIELQSLMQHYGCPTALMDWTHSPYVALYFATEDAIDDRKRSGSVYALNGYALHQTLQRYLLELGIHLSQAPQTAPGAYASDDLEKMAQFDYTGNHGYIALIEPYRKNTRLFTQQGCFTLTGNLRYGFLENLAIELDFAKSLPVSAFNSRNMLFRLEISNQLKRAIQERLLLMNITAYSLFPGLEGYARYWNQYLLEKELRFDKLVPKIVKVEHIEENPGSI